MVIDRRECGQKCSKACIRTSKIAWFEHRGCRLITNGTIVIESPWCGRRSSIVRSSIIVYSVVKHRESSSGHGSSICQAVIDHRELFGRTAIDRRSFSCLSSSIRSSNIDSLFGCRSSREFERSSIIESCSVIDHRSSKVRLSIVESSVVDR